LKKLFFMFYYVFFFNVGSDFGALSIRGDVSF